MSDIVEGFPVLKKTVTRLSMVFYGQRSKTFTQKTQLKVPKTEVKILKTWRKTTQFLKGKNVTNCRFLNRDNLIKKTKYGSSSGIGVRLNRDVHQQQPFPREQ